MPIHSETHRVLNFHGLSCQFLSVPYSLLLFRKALTLYLQIMLLQCDANLTWLYFPESTFDQQSITQQNTSYAYKKRERQFNKFSMIKLSPLLCALSKKSHYGRVHSYIKLSHHHPRETRRKQMNQDLTIPTKMCPKWQEHIQRGLSSKISPLVNFVPWGTRT